MNALTFFLPAITLASTLSPTGQQRPQAPTRGAASGAPIALSTLNPRQIGPAVTSGRVISIAVHPNDKTTWYVGAACGGVWKTTNNGTTFTPIFDNEASYSIGTITIDPKRPNIVWVGSGENNAQRSVGWGDGVYKSEDGGRSWKNMGLKSSEHIGKIIVDPRNPDTVWVAAQGPLWSAGGERGLYRTTDGGKTWKNMLAVSENTGITDILLDPQNPEIIYAASWQRRRHFFTYIGGGSESGIHRSTDGGATWTKLRGGLPGGDMGRIGLAASPANPAYIYATVEAQSGASGTYRTTDQGTTWEKRGDFVAQGMYYGQIICDPIDAERIYILSVSNQVSNDGGRTTTDLGERNKHVDNHALWIDPSDTRHILAGCDGGIYESFDRGSTWVFKSNLPIAQFYRIAVDDSKPFYNVYGGTQDNNSIGGPSRSKSSRGVGSAEWFVTAGGDGFHQAVEPGNPDVVYSESQDGGLVRFDRKTGARTGIAPLPAKGAPPLRFYWDSPLLISPHNPKRLWYGANILFRSDDRGDSWTAVSGDLTKQVNRNNLKVMGQPQKLDTIARGQSTSFYGNIISIDESPKKEGLVYAGTDDGLFHITPDGGKTWRKLDKVTGVPEGTYVGRILASRHAVNTVYALFDNHKNGDYKPYVMKSTDQGETWEAITGNLPDSAPALSIVQDHVDPKLLFVGTETGLYVTTDEGKAWHKVRGIPTIAVRDLKIQTRENDLVVGTFGRGIWILDDYSAIRGESTWKDTPAAILPVKDVYNWISFDGRTGSEGETLWYAANPPGGANFLVWVKENAFKSLKQKREEAEAEARKKGENPPFPTADQLRAEADEEGASLIATITDSKGGIVRRLIQPMSTGLRKITWDLRMPGTAVGLQSSAPAAGGRGGRGGRGGGGGGFVVMPGEYKVALSKRIAGVETELVKPVAFKVALEGEEKLTASERATIQSLREKVTRVQKSLTATLEVLDNAQGRIGAIRSALEQSPTSTDALRKEAASIEKALEDIAFSLRGDDISSVLVEPSPMTTVRRIQDGAFALLGSSLMPTKTRIETLNIGIEELTAILPKLRVTALEQLPKLEKQLDAAGIMHTPGRLPQLP